MADVHIIYRVTWKADDNVQYEDFQSLVEAKDFASEKEGATVVRLESYL